MTPDQAAWVREHVWTAGMRKTHREVPGFYPMCACQYSGGPCSGRLPQHGTCHIGVPLPMPECHISTRHGGVAAFTAPYRHPTASATGWHYTTAAQLWLADRRCAWWCRCDCGHPYVPAHAPEKNPARPIRYEAVELPGLELAGVR
ncbi:DUF6248 family natural product biosynthesis protein [Streptosporangium canum]|uniref:DUF6248 family natural product biosynthesis protein n=1 Tax=Streptosporangium canum TaxID=324952 RepID=UPI003436CD5F